MDFFERKVKELFEHAGIQVNGPAPHDITVHNPKFYRRFLTDARLGLGESYMDGWWDCERIDEMMYKLYSAQLQIAEHIQTPATMLGVLAGKILPELQDDNPVNAHDPSTNGLINTFKEMRKGER